MNRFDCGDAEIVWNPAEEESGGVGVQTARYCSLRAEETLPEPLAQEEEATDEPEPTPPRPQQRDAYKERRHLAGANWLDDWMRYFPA